MTERAYLQDNGAAAKTLLLDLAKIVGLAHLISTDRAWAWRLRLTRSQRRR